jgi:RNA polymerase sigma factor (sigma-70 family)
MAESVNQFERLMEQVRGGSEQAAEQVCREYASHVIRVVRRRLHSRLRRRLDSGDVLQAVWASFFAIPAERFSFQTPEQLIGFLCQVAKNKVIDETRRGMDAQKRQVTREEYVEQTYHDKRLPDPRQPTASKGLIAEESWEQLLRDQPSLIRDILELRRLGFTMSEIGARLGIQVKSIRRYLKKLAEELPS